MMGHTFARESAQKRHDEMATKFPMLTNYDDSAHRTKRLERVKALYGRRRSYIEVQSNLIGLHDHKGALVVAWLHDPAPEDTQAMCAAWESVGEDPDEVHQYALFSVADIQSFDHFLDIADGIFKEFVAVAGALASYPILVAGGDW